MELRLVYKAAQNIYAILLLTTVAGVSNGLKSSTLSPPSSLSHSTTPQLIQTPKPTLPAASSASSKEPKQPGPTRHYLLRSRPSAAGSSKDHGIQQPLPTPDVHRKPTQNNLHLTSAKNSAQASTEGAATVAEGDDDVRDVAEVMRPTPVVVSYTSENTIEINGTEYAILDHNPDMDPDEMNSLLSRTKRGKKHKATKVPSGDSRRYRKKDYSFEYQIKRALLRDRYYDRTTRPVRNDSTTTDLYVGMSLYHILDTNEKYQTLKALIAVRLRWVDEFLRWDPAKNGGVEHVWVPAMDIWRPDIFINNFADDSFQDFMDTYAIVTSNGSVLWMFPAVVTTYCTLDVRHFPFDRQKCQIIFISWTFHGFKLNVTYNVSEHNTVYYTPKNQEWYVDKIGVDRHEKIYACCIEPYPDVTFTIHMTRRSLFYIINLIFPCLLIYAVSFLGFFLPVESGEKVNLEITILLALVVFLLIVGETLPPTPDAIPALGVLFGTTMLMVSIALVMAVIVTNIFLRKDSGHRVPVCLRKIFIGKSSRSSLSNKVTHTENHILESKIQEIEIDNLSNQSEAETLTCRSRCSRKRSGTPFRNSDLDLQARISHEWQVLAKCVDRMFFWLFLAASVAALTSMFLQVPAYNAT